ncbi:MAG: hypothetical protein ACXWYD_11025 [Candidatus Binatia bacterium]
MRVYLPPVGYPAGSTHDLWARLVGSYMSKFILGNPNINSKIRSAPSQRLNRAQPLTD